MKPVCSAGLVLFLALAARGDEKARLGARVRDGDGETRIEFQRTYEALSGSPLVAHVHFGQRGAAGGARAPRGR